MEFTVQTTNTFLSLYNEIDALFSNVLGIHDYLPFHEKIHSLVDGSYNITHCVRKFQQKLRYFGDMRNQIVHGFHQDHHHYMMVSEYACEQIRYVHDALYNPKPILEIFSNSLLVVSPFLTLGDALHFHHSDPSKVMVLWSPGGGFTGVVTPPMLTSLLSFLYAEDQSSFALLHAPDNLLWNLFQRAHISCEIMRITPGTHLYAVEAMFLCPQVPDVVLITDAGFRGQEPLGGLTIQDLPKLMPYVQL